MDAYAHGQTYAVVAHQVCVQGADGLNNAQAGVHGPLGIVFMRLRIAKVPLQQRVRNAEGTEDLHGSWLHRQRRRP